MSRNAPWPNYSQAEIDAVAAVLHSGKVNYWTGEQGRRFENEFAKFAGSHHAIALANGTLALDLALHGLGIGARNGGRDDDQVIVTPRSFVASASCIVNAGAVPVFADVDLDSQNITPKSVAPRITPKTKAVLCVHLAGWPCDMDGFRDLTHGKDIALIEDCAQAHGAKYKGKPVGGLGDVAAWSFCQDKIMTTGGEGGMVTCNDEDLWRRMWAFKDHGKSYAAVYERQHPEGFRWLHESFGSNFRLTEMQAALGRLQLKKMPEWHKARQKNAQTLTNALREFVKNGWLRIPQIDQNLATPATSLKGATTHAYYRLYGFLQPEFANSGLSRDDLVKYFNGLDVACFHGSCAEIYREKSFDTQSFAVAQPLENAVQLGKTSLMFLVHPGVEMSDHSFSLPD